MICISGVNFHALPLGPVFVSSRRHSWFLPLLQAIRLLCGRHPYRMGGFGCEYFLCSPVCCGVRYITDNRRKVNVYLINVAMSRLINVVRARGGNSRAGTGTPRTWETGAEARRRNRLAPATYRLSCRWDCCSRQNWY